MNIKRESMTDIIIILRGYFNFRHVSIGMKFISHRARRDCIVSGTQLRWHLHFHLLGNVVDVSLAYLHRGDEQCISRRSWFPIMFHEVAGEDFGGRRGRGLHYSDASGERRGKLTIQSFIMWQAEVIPSFRRQVLFTHRYLSSPVLPRNLSNSYERHSTFCKDDLYALACVAHRWTIGCLAAGTTCSSFSPPLFTPYYALIARPPY